MILPRLVLAAAAVLVAGCASGGGAPAGEPLGTSRVLQSDAAAPIPALDALAVRVPEEGAEAAVRLSARLHAALRRHGVRPDVAAPLALTVRLGRPLSWRAQDRGPFSIEGRVGSSSETDIGIGIELPPGDAARPPEPVRFFLAGTLEDTRTGRVLWRGRAAVETLPGGAERAIDRLSDALVDALAAAAQAAAHDGPNAGNK